MEKIPKIIHYCWFGGGEKDYLVSACMSTWSKLKGYKFILWNEDNCDMNENLYIKQCYEERKYAYVSDYFRLKALNEWGGVYLDTDVFIRKDFDDLLDYDMFISFIYDHSIGTAVIGAKKGHPFVKQLLDMYSDLNTPVVNNDIVTKLICQRYNNAVINGKTQFLGEKDYDSIKLFHKQEFETGYVFKKGHAVHLCDGSWWRKTEDKKHNKRKVMLTKIPIIHCISIVKLVTAKLQTKRATKDKNKN